MNQQSGMEADKEIDRFLQKVKKRDMPSEIDFTVGNVCTGWKHSWLFGTVRGDLVSVL